MCRCSKRLFLRHPLYQSLPVEVDAMHGGYGQAYSGIGSGSGAGGDGIGNYTQTEAGGSGTQALVAYDCGQTQSGSGVSGVSYS